jgi:hypothetical protein
MQDPDRGVEVGWAFYYPGAIWRSPDRLKSLLLFFDGVALLVPSYMRDRPEQLDPVTVTALREHDLLRILEPEALVDTTAAEDLAAAVNAVLDAGVLGPPQASSVFEELSYSRLGGLAYPSLAKDLCDRLLTLGFARPSKDGVSVPLDPRVRGLVLVLLAQLLRRPAARLGLQLQPVTDVPQVHEALVELLDQPPLPSAGHVVSVDLDAAVLDLSAVPLDEVLAFRHEYGVQYRAYARDVRRCVRELGQLTVEDRAQVLADRCEELRDRASVLRARTRGLFSPGVIAGLALSAAGGVWDLASNDPISGLLALGGVGVAAASAAFAESGEASAFSFLLQARTQFAR